MPRTASATVFECDNCPTWTKVDDAYLMGSVGQLVPPAGWYLVVEGGNDPAAEVGHQVACSVRCLYELSRDRLDDAVTGSDPARCPACGHLPLAHSRDGCIAADPPLTGWPCGCQHVLGSGGVVQAVQEQADRGV